jgi:uncharacterized damage-inducible protein DinB
MNKEIQSIRHSLENTLRGEPWYGRSLYDVLDKVDSKKVYQKPGGRAHSLIELLYHLVTWSDFTRAQIGKEHPVDVLSFEKMDWRTINPSIHNWKSGLQQLKESNEQILDLLNEKEDGFLDQMPDGRQYNFRFLLNGLIQHHIYHLGQIACTDKLLIENGGL